MTFILPTQCGMYFLALQLLTKWFYLLQGSVTDFFLGFSQSYCTTLWHWKRNICLPYFLFVPKVIFIVEIFMHNSWYSQGDWSSNKKEIFSLFCWFFFFCKLPWMVSLFVSLLFVYHFIYTVLEKYAAYWQIIKGAVLYRYMYN